MVFGLFYEGYLIEQRDLTYVVILHTASVGATLLGGLGRHVMLNRKLASDKPGLALLKPRFYLLSYFFAVLGLLISVLQIQQSTSISSYFHLLFSSSPQVDIRGHFLTESSDGGLPGYVKMWANSTLGVLLLCLALIRFFSFTRAEKRRIRTLLIVCSVCFILKTMISLDRLSIMALLLSGTFFISYVRPRYKLILFLLSAFLIVQADFISRTRLADHGLLEFVLLYFKLGLTNFDIAIETISAHTFGFSTFLNPINFALSVISVEPLFPAEFNWTWNPAQYGGSYLYMDFGMLFLVAFSCIGFTLKHIDIAVAKKHIGWTSVYFVVLYGAVSFLFVPAVRGLEFWISFLVCWFIGTTSITFSASSRDP